MTAVILAIALAAQAAAGVQPQTAPGSITGVVVHTASGDPLPNVRVTLARIDVPKAAAEALMNLAGQDPEGAPPVEITLPAEFIEMMTGQMEMAQRQMDMARRAGTLDIAESEMFPEDMMRSMALFKELSVDNIHSIMVDPSGKLAIIPKSAPPALTDSAGRFSFSNLEPGVYRLIFAANGMVRQDLGQRGAGGGTPVSVAAGQSVDGLIMRMTPAGAISGRLTDRTGQALAGVPVQLARPGYDSSGKRTAKMVASTRTNDRGEYRFYFLTPGRYTVQAGTPQIGQPAEAELLEMQMAMGGMMSMGTAAISPNRIDQRYALIHYPGTSDPTAAVPVDAPSGSETSGIDFVMSAERLYRVRGRIIDPRTGQPPQSVYVRLESAEGGTSMTSTQQFYNPADGSFDLRDVAAGNYILRADLPNLGRQGFGGVRGGVMNMTPEERRALAQAQEAAAMAEQAAMPRIAMPLAVNGNIEGLTPTAVVGSPLAGRIRVEPSGAAQSARLSQVVIELRALGANGAPLSNSTPYASFMQNVKADGAFRIEGALPGEYSFRIRAGIPGFYLKSARIGGVDALNGAITLPLRDPNAVLEVVISRNGGQIAGTATALDGRPVPGAQVALVPNDNRHRSELFRPVAADAEGRFTIQDVAPGEYRLAAWPWLEAYSWFDPIVIRQAEENGKPVRITESSNQNINVQIIATPD